MNTSPRAARVLMSRHVTGSARLPHYARAYDGLRFPDQDQRIYGRVHGAGPSSQVTSGRHECAADEVTVRPDGYANLAYFIDSTANGVEHLLKPSDERWDPLLQSPKCTTRIYEV